MSRSHYRGSLAGAVVVLALLAPRFAHAQAAPHWYGPPPPTGGAGNALVNGYAYEILNRQRAEQQLRFYQNRYQNDSARGAVGAANFDAHRIDRLRYRIAVDGWLIRKSMLCDPGVYPIRNDANCLP